VVPNARTINRQARRVLEQRLVEEAIAKARNKIDAQVKAFKLPAGLDVRIGKLLAADPALAWDASNGQNRPRP
jgi:hypothetical protein